MNFIVLNLIFLFHLNQQEIDINKLKKDTVLIEYKKVMTDLNEGVMSKRYQIPYNAIELQKEIAKNPTKENLKKLYKTAGMKNADEYLDKLFLQTSLMMNFLKKHPEISKLNQQTKTELITKLLFN